MQGYIRDYQSLGLILVPLKPNDKAPLNQEWAKAQNCIDTYMPFPGGCGIGLAHAYSRTVAIDVDNYEAARQWFEEHSLQLDFYSSMGVKIVSGKENHGKLIYRLPAGIDPLPSWTVTKDKKHCFQFRCATRKGTTTQDVLPPSIHPDTGKPYRWGGDYKNIPELPKELLVLWKTATQRDDTAKALGDVQASQAELESALAALDPDMHRDDWVKIGMALHSVDPALEWLFDEWSAEGAKYAGSHDIEAVWASFHDEPNGITARTLFKEARSAGWTGYRRPVDEIFSTTAAAMEIIQPVAPPAPPEVQIPTSETPPPPAPRPKGLFARVSEHLDTVQLAPRWLIKGIMERGQVGLLYGASQALKSYAALDLATAVALGRDWQGHAVNEAGGVWFLAGEGNQILWRRMEAIKQHLGVLTSSFDNLFLSYRGLNLMDDEALKQLQAVAVDLGQTPKLLIIDTLSRNAILDENSARDAADLIDRCDAIARNWDCTVLLVHHIGKKGTTARGSNAWEANTDFRYFMERDTSHSQRIITSMDIVKLKGAPEPAEPVIFEGKHITLVGRQDEDGAPLSDLVLERMSKTHQHVDVKDKRKLREGQQIVLNMARELLADRSSLDGGEDVGFMKDDLWRIYEVKYPEETDGSVAKKCNLDRALASLVKHGYLDFDDTPSGVWYTGAKR